MNTFEDTETTVDPISDGLMDMDWEVRHAAIQHPNVTPAHIAFALKDMYWRVRAAAVMRPTATATHITRALGDMDQYVRAAAVRHPNTTAEHINTALKYHSQYVQLAAIQNPNATAEHISIAMKSADWRVRHAAIQHPNATPEHTDIALKDDNQRVRDMGKWRQQHEEQSPKGANTMNALDRFKPKFDESIKDINHFMADPVMGELARWMLNTETNPYYYLCSAWTDSWRTAELFAHLLRNIDWAIQSNDIAFARLNGRPVIAFINKDHPRFNEKLLDSFRRGAWDNPIEILDIKPNEFGRIYDVYVKER